MLMMMPMIKMMLELTLQDRHQAGPGPVSGEEVFPGTETLLSPDQRTEGRLQTQDYQVVL